MKNCDGPVDKTHDEESENHSSSSSPHVYEPRYGKPLFFFLIIAVLIGLFLILSGFGQRESLNANLLLYALITTAITGVLGGTGAIKSTEGYVAGAMGIFLVFLVSVEGGRSYWYSSEIDTNRNQLEALKSEYAQKIKDKDLEIAELKQSYLAVDLIIGCIGEPGKTTVFVVQDTETGAQRSGRLRLAELSKSMQYMLHIKQEKNQVIKSQLDVPSESVAIIPESYRVVDRPVETGESPPVIFVHYRPANRPVAGDINPPEVTIQISPSYGGNPCSRATR